MEKNDMSDKEKISNSINTAETELKNSSQKIIDTDTIGSPTLTEGKFYVFK